MKKKGVIKLYSGIIKILLSNGKVKNIIRILENNIDPESSEELARVIVRTDFEFFMGLAGIIPSLVNTVIIFSNSMVLEFKRLPPALINNFVDNVMDDIEKNKLDELKSNIYDLFNEKMGLSSEVVLFKLLDSLKRFLDKNPEIRNRLKEIVCDEKRK